MPGHYCNYCCLKEFGDDFFEDKNKCLKTCLEDEQKKDTEVNMVYAATEK